MLPPGRVFLIEGKLHQQPTVLQSNALHESTRDALLKDALQNRHLGQRIALQGGNHLGRDVNPVALHHRPNQNLPGVQGADHVLQAVRSEFRQRQADAVHGDAVAVGGF